MQGFLFRGSCVGDRLQGVVCSDGFQEGYLQVVCRGRFQGAICRDHFQEGCLQKLYAGRHLLRVVCRESCAEVVCKRSCTESRLRDFVC